MAQALQWSPGLRWKFIAIFFRGCRLESGSLEEVPRRLPVAAQIWEKIWI